MYIFVMQKTMVQWQFRSNDMFHSPINIPSFDLSWAESSARLSAFSLGCHKRFPLFMLKIYATLVRCHPRSRLLSFVVVVVLFRGSCLCLCPRCCAFVWPMCLAFCAFCRWRALEVASQPEWTGSQADRRTDSQWDGTGRHIVRTRVK